MPGTRDGSQGTYRAGQMIDSNRNGHTAPSTGHQTLELFNPNTAGNAAHAFFLISACPASHPSTQLSQNPQQSPPQMSLNERTCNSFVPDRLEESVIRSTTFSCVSDTLGPAALREGQLNEEHGLDVFDTKTKRWVSLSSISRSVIRPFTAAWRISGGSRALVGRRTSINDSGPLRAAM